MTGKLAERSVRGVAQEIRDAGIADPIVVVLNIQVAALMTTEWIARKLEISEPIDRIILPGYCRGDAKLVSEKLGVLTATGPKDVHDLPEMLSGKAAKPTELLDYSIQILAEINHAARLPMATILELADAYRRDGADVIDVGCDPLPGGMARDSWSGVSEVVRELRARGHRVSIDSFDPREVDAATAAGAELVLSVNSSNVDAAKDWHGAEVVAVPDTPADLASMDRTIEKLEKSGVKYRLDPIIEPIGMGFANSLGRYLETRRRYPKAPMMLGIGNLSELTAVDSAGVNMTLVGFCEELSIGSVLTTQVINWARSSVKEIDLARRLVHHAVKRRVPPKRADQRLVSLRDPRVRAISESELNDIASQLTDKNIRIMADVNAGRLHVMNKDFHLQGDDAFVLFDQMKIEDASHAFYLGWEMAKAMMAIQLGKNYTQDQSLRWGWLTREEVSHHERRKGAKKKE